ncbi:hypothetical protein LT875_002528 [Salmonella enterica]|nr:hypothetical protein [Salmonella enterica]
MALDTLPADGKLPDTQPATPDQALAKAWVREYGGKLAYYAGAATTPAGYVHCDAPSINYAGRKSYSVPQVRSLADEKLHDEYLKKQEPKEADQPDWKHFDGYDEPQSQPATVNRPPSTDPIGQPDFGWIPNPQDLDPEIKRQKDVVGGDKVPVTEPDFEWDAGNGDQKPIAKAVVNRPPSTDPLGQPPFGWTPQRQISVIDDARLKAIKFHPGDTLQLADLMISTVPTDEYDFTTDKDDVAKVDLLGVMTAVKVGDVAIRAQVKGFEDYLAFFTLSVTAKP